MVDFPVCFELCVDDKLSTILQYRYIICHRVFYFMLHAANAFYFEVLTSANFVLSV